MPISWQRRISENVQSISGLADFRRQGTADYAKKYNFAD